MSAPATVNVNDAFPSGTIIGNKYLVGGVLGSGGMGVVLSATHIELDTPVAIKVAREELAKNPELASQLLFEARAVARLRSTHVVRILDVDRLQGGAPYIVMEQLRGTDLATFMIERGALSVSDAVGYLQQVCEGLREAHALGIIHRDLKPENLFLAQTPEGEVLKILDFGISKYVGSSLRRAPRSTLTKAGNAVGSPFYMAPEQMRAAPDLDARADIWSLGAILYELLTGRCPFEAESVAALCAKVMSEDAPSLRAFSESIPEQLDEIVRRCLEKDPNARFQNVAEMAEALRIFAAADTASSARHASGIDLRVALEEVQPRSGRGTLIALVGVCLMLVVASIAFWELQFRTPTLGASAFAGEPPLRSRPLPRFPPAGLAPNPSVSEPAVSEPAVSAPAVSAPAVSAPAVSAPRAHAVRPGPLRYVPPAPTPKPSNTGTDPAFRYGL